MCFEDLGISGWSGDHAEIGGFSKLIAAIEAGKIKAGDVVLVEAMDRAGRLPALEMVGHISKILNAGVLLVTLDDGMTYTQESANGQHLFLLVAKFQQANQYSEALSRRIKASYADRRAKAAAGVSIKRSTPVWLDKEGQLIESLAPFIVQAFEDYAIGFGERRILDRIRGKHPLLEKLNPSTIKRWMSNTTAIGMWGNIPDVHPPVVTKELFYRVQRRLDTPSAKAANAAPTTHLLTGLVKCGECGSNMIYKALRHSPHVMACGKRARFGVTECSNKTNWPALLLDYIRSNTMIGAVQRAMAGLNASDNDKKRIEIEGEIQAVSKSITRLVGVLAEHDIQEVQDSLATAVAKRDKLRVQLALVLSSPVVQSFDYALDVSEALLDDDEQRLNTLLQGAGYVIACKGRTATVNETSIYTDATTQTYEYTGVHRASKSYTWTENGNALSMKMLNTEL
jgi:DNA invertase Pin-like site-specific DNA recombinase